MSQNSQQLHDHSLPKQKRSTFNIAEDEMLSQLVQQFGLEKWEKIAKFIPGKNPRQCHDRWKAYLSPRVSNHPWTTEEDQFLIEKVKEIGKRWVQLTSFFPFRSDISLKNRFQLLLRKQLKEAKLNEVHSKDTIESSFENDLFGFAETSFDWNDFVF
jgi:hypothetical protein